MKYTFFIIKQNRNVEQVADTEHHKADSYTYSVH